jgi:hypothetical protein
MITSRIPIRIHHKDREPIQATHPTYYATETGVARFEGGAFIPDYLTVTSKVMTKPTSGADPGGALWLDCVNSLRKSVIAIQREADTFQESIRGFEGQVLQWSLVQGSETSVLTFRYALLGYTEPLHIPNPQGFAYALATYRDIDLGEFRVGCHLNNVHDSLVKPLHQDPGGFRHATLPLLTYGGSLEEIEGGLRQSLQMIALLQDEVSRLSEGMKTL